MATETPSTKAATDEFEELEDAEGNAVADIRREERVRTFRTQENKSGAVE